MSGVISFNKKIIGRCDMYYQKSITATVYIYNNGKVLLHKHKKYNTWFPVGGHVKENEFPHEAAIREAKEESGLSVVLWSNEFLPSTDLGRVQRLPLPFCTYYEGINGSEEFYDFIYIATINSNDTIAPETGESLELQWFSKEELRNVEKPHVRNTAIAVIEYMESNQED